MLLARTNKTQPSTPSNCESRYQHRSNQKPQGDTSSATRMVMEGEIIIFEKLAPVAESPGESSPPVVASPALQQPPIIELLVTQQLPCVQLTTQPSSVEKSSTQQDVDLLSTSNKLDRRVWCVVFAVCDCRFN